MLKYLILSLQLIYCYSLLTNSYNRLVINKHKSTINKKGLLDNNINDAIVEGLKIIPIPKEYQSVQSSGNSDFNSVSDLQNIAIIVGGIAFLTYERRPRGSADNQLLEIKRSTIPNANFGVFAKKFIPEGTRLGSFPGFIKRYDTAMEKKSNDQARKVSQRYIWGLDEDIILDPTNNEGLLELELKYLFGLYKVDTIIARINEPPVGKDINAYVRIQGSEVEVFTERDIFPDEEIFIDYGLKYNRDNYNDISTADAIKKLTEQEANNNKDNEIKSQRIQSVIFDPTTSNEEVIDTTIKGGFLDKLKQQDEALTKTGIISPDEAIKKFADIGSGMFESEEDQEIINSLLGKSIDKKETKSKDNEDQLVDLIDKQMDKSINKEANDIFSSLITDNKKSNLNNKDAISNPNKDLSNDLSKEALEIQSKLNNMTEEQIEKVFNKLKDSLDSKITSDIKNVIKEVKTNKPKKTIKLSNKSTDSLNDNEINLVEKELENIVNNPMKIWKDLIDDPDKYLTPEEIKEIEKYID